MDVIVHPRPLPCGVQAVEFEPNYVQAVNRSRGGEAQGVELADPRWRAKITWAPQDRAGFQARRAWLDGARGVLVRVLVHDALQPYPLRYKRAALEALTRAGGAAFDGTAAVAALGASTLSLSTLPAGFALAAGDYVGLVEGSRYGLVRVFADAEASAGGAVALTVYPTGQTRHFTTAARAQLVRPSCHMVLDPGSIAAARSAGARAPASFSATQVLP